MARLTGRQSITIDPSWFDQLEEWIDDNRAIEKNFKFGMDGIVMLYAYTTLAAAQARSAGPVGGGKRLLGRRFIGQTSGPSTPEPQWSGGAWKIPVRRLTGEYYEGWYVERLALAEWAVGNHSREAYFIEYGINHPSTGLTDSAGNRVRVRRPILKLAVLQAINTANRTKEDVNAFAKLLGVTGGIYHSPALYDPPVGGPRTYPLSDELRKNLANTWINSSRNTTGVAPIE